MPLRKFFEDAAKTVADGAAGAADFISKSAADVGKKAGEAVSAGASAVADAGGKAVEGIANGANAVVNAAQQFQREQQLAHYNPVFPDEYSAPDYDLPNLIIIEDEDQRKDVEVCKGSIGWLEKKDGMEILHLYEEAVPFSGLEFYPHPMCEAAYYFDSFNKDRFIQLDAYHEVIQQERVTELRNIAHALGAKECYLETYEEDHSYAHSKQSKGGSVSSKISAIGNSSGSASQEVSDDQTQKRTVIYSQVFEGNDNPSRPELNWFKKDKEINSLIEARCSQENTLKEYSILIDTASSLGMSVSRAAKLDNALKGVKVKSNFSFEDEIRNESRRKLVYNIKF